MTLVRWEPLRELNSLQHEMNRLFNGFFDSPPQAANGTGGGRWLPAMDLVETDEQFVLRADLPGVAEDEVQIELEGNLLTIAGERQAEHAQREEGFYRLERASGRFNRSLTVPDGVNGEEITANFDRGVLEVQIPKPEQRKPRRVAIGVGEKTA